VLVDGWFVKEEFGRAKDWQLAVSRRKKKFFDGNEGARFASSLIGTATSCSDTLPRSAMLDIFEMSN